jgi:Glycosyltransferase family 87
MKCAAAASARNRRVATASSRIADRRFVRPVPVICALVGFAFALGVGLEMAKNIGPLDDFLQFYTGAKLLYSGKLYDVDSEMSTQKQYAGTRDDPQRYCYRLPFYYLFLRPLAWMSYRTARNVWFWLMVVACVAIALVWRQAWLAVAVSLPLASSILGEHQDVALVTLLIAVIWILHSRGWMFAAGLIAALLSIKIQLFLLIPAIFLFHRKWRVFSGFLAGGSLLFAMSYVAGRQWVPAYIHMIAEPNLGAGLGGMPTIRGVFYQGAPWLVWAACGAVAAITLWCARRRFDIAFAAAFLGSFLICQHAYLHDCGVLMPAFLVCLPLGGGPKWLAMTLLSPLPYFAPALFGLREGIGPAVLIVALLISLVFWNDRKQAAT